MTLHEIWTGNTSELTRSFKSMAIFVIMAVYDDQLSKEDLILNLIGHFSAFFSDRQVVKVKLMVVVVSEW